MNYSHVQESSRSSNTESRICFREKKYPKKFLPSKEYERTQSQNVF